MVYVLVGEYGMFSNVLHTNVSANRRKPNGDVYHGFFIKDKIHGKGIYSFADIPSGAFRRLGVYCKGELRRWICWMPEPTATNGFLENFNNPEDLGGVYALSIGMGLPILPPGVDPKDPRVLKVVGKMTRLETPDMIGSDTEKRTKAILEGLTAPIAKAVAESEALKKRLAKLKQEIEPMQKKIHDQLGYYYTSRNERAGKIKELEEFWEQPIPRVYKNFLRFS